MISCFNENCKSNEITVMRNLAETFHSLHKEKDILVLPNAWDAGSAKVIEDAGAKAIATSSAGVAWALGYPDGDVLPPRMLTDLTARITNVIRIPLSVDFEGGYTKNPAKAAENLKPIIDAGAVGINIEDGEGTLELLAKKIEKARNTAESVGVNFIHQCTHRRLLARDRQPRKSRRRDHRPCCALP